MRIKGHEIPAPRPTRWAGIVFLLRYGLPIVLFGATLDVLLLLIRAR